MHKSRPQLSKEVRHDAAELASRRTPAKHCNNNEEYEYRDFSQGNAPATHIANFTKGLPHDPETGLLLNPVDYNLLVNGIQSGNPADFLRTPLGPGKLAATPSVPSLENITSETADRRKFWLSAQAKQHPLANALLSEKGARVRAWESAGAGNVLDLEGPDAQAVTMPPAPRLDSDELLAEIAEVYSMALLRDFPFSKFPLPKQSCGKVERDVTKPRKSVSASEFMNAHRMLSELPWFSGDESEWDFSEAEISRRRNLASDGSNLFRGTTPGENVGPYLSQFLLLGNPAIGGGRLLTDGFVRYGAISIQQKVREADCGKDYMTVWEQYLDVQNGADLRGIETYVKPDGVDQGHRFIATPRDLATYVHFDALYEAYLNACLVLLASDAPLDRGIPFSGADTFDKQQGFAHFGGPHVLTLVCEAATRALKAVRFQKFAVHRRLRPEAVGGRVDRWINESKLQDGPLRPLKQLMEGDDFRDGFCDLRWSTGKLLIDKVKAHNALNNKQFKEKPATRDSYLLPMAFPEGSPMHPAYGAGHATVAGACVTILKAYFDHGWTAPGLMENKKPIAYLPNNDGSDLLKVQLHQPLTVEGELNKLAANISIGRNWAGVHYYSDYIESMRLGEEIAIGILEEQKLTYPENFTMTVPLFDGGAVRI